MGAFGVVASRIWVGFARGLAIGYVTDESGNCHALELPVSPLTLQEILSSTSTSTFTFSVLLSSLLFPSLLLQQTQRNCFQLL